MFVKLAFLDDLFINFWSWFGTIIINNFLLLIIIETSKIEIFMHLLELFVINIGIKVHIVELLKLIDFLSFMGESSWSLSILNQREFGSSFGDFHHLIAFFLLEHSLFGISYFLNLFLLGCWEFIRVLIKSGYHWVFTRSLLVQLRIVDLLSHVVDIIVLVWII